jgi:hypothetical protein
LSQSPSPSIYFNLISPSFLPEVPLITPISLDIRKKWQRFCWELYDRVDIPVWRSRNKKLTRNYQTEEPEAEMMKRFYAPAFTLAFEDPSHNDNDCGFRALMTPKFKLTLPGTNTVLPPLGSIKDGSARMIFFGYKIISSPISEEEDLLLLTWEDQTGECLGFRVLDYKGSISTREFSGGSSRRGGGRGRETVDRIWKEIRRVTEESSRVWEVVVGRGGDGWNWSEIGGK